MSDDRRERATYLPVACFNPSDSMTYVVLDLDGEVKKPVRRLRFYRGLVYPVAVAVLEKARRQGLWGGLHLIVYDNQKCKVMCEVI